MLKGPWWAKTGQICLYGLISFGLLVGTTGCGGSTGDESPKAANHDPQHGWVYIPYGSSSWDWDLRYRCIGPNLYIQNAADGDGPILSKDDRKCKKNAQGI